MKVLKEVTFFTYTAFFVLTSCGDSSKNNNHNTSNWEHVKAQYQCQGQGTQVRMKDLSFQLTSQNLGGGMNCPPGLSCRPFSEATTQLSGPMRPGSFQGPVVTAYMGRVHNRNDLIYIQKVYLGGMIRYNVVLSLCTYVFKVLERTGHSFNYHSNPNATIKYIVSPETDLSHFNINANLDNMLNNGTHGIPDTSTTNLGRLTRAEVQFYSSNHHYNPISQTSNTYRQSNTRTFLPL